jgi:hypothetical protein
MAQRQADHHEGDDTDEDEVAVLPIARKLAAR